eukprot:3448213-Ditylum_brightwellii.AAC.1
MGCPQHYNPTEALRSMRSAAIDTKRSNQDGALRSIWSIERGSLSPCTLSLYFLLISGKKAVISFSVHL